LPSAFLLGLGVVSLALGVAFRAGHLRNRAANFRSPGAPLIVRHASMAILPSGMSLVLLGLLSLQDPGQGTPDGLFGLTASAALAAASTALLAMRRPPEWAKPSWIKSLERSDAAPATYASPFEERALAVLGIALALLATLFLIGSLVGLAT